MSPEVTVATEKAKVTFSCLTAVLPCQSSPSYLAGMSACHQRAAECMVEGAIRNGGIYIKLGQGLCSFNHLLPPEYIRTLQILEDKALNRKYKEVRTVTQNKALFSQRGQHDISQTCVCACNRWMLFSKKTSTKVQSSFLKSLTMSPSLLPAWLRFTRQSCLMEPLSL